MRFELLLRAMIEAKVSKFAAMMKVRTWKFI